MPAENENVDDDKPPGSLVVSISSHLRKLAKKSPAVKREFYPSEEESLCSASSYIDPLLEEKFTKTKGLVHKYPSRVLITLTASCAAYCRFCTRRRMVGDIEKGKLTKGDVDKMVEYLNSNKSINEVILSGGDPFTVPDLLVYTISKIKRLKQIKIIRIHTRVPVSCPSAVTPEILKAIKSIKTKPIYLSIHFEHPDELTKPTIRAVKAIREAGAILLSQSVFLKGVNDSFKVLRELFTRLSELGIRPYYLYRCDPVRGVEHFMVPFEKEIEIMTKLRSVLSGIACPTYVIDTPNGSGKIPVPLEYWKFERQKFKDFDGNQITVI